MEEKMKKTKVFYLVVVLAVSALLLSAANARAVSEEARRHMDRGQAAVEMANAPEDYEAAIKEFKQAISLAPDWPAPYYNLGLAQEKAGKFREAVTSFEQYLRLAPNASDAKMVKSLITKLEYKAEQEITDDEALNIFASLADSNQWQLKGITNANLFSRDIGWVKWFRRSSEPGRQNLLEFEYFTMYNCPTLHGVCPGSALPMGKVVEFQTHYKLCEGDGCLSTYNYRLEIMSRNKVTMFLRVYRAKEIGGGTSEASYEFVRR
jgi:Tfp pilus assembly protein PilF